MFTAVCSKTTNRRKRFQPERASTMTDPNPEKVNTTVSYSALLRLFSSRAARGLNPDDDTSPEEALEDIKNACDNALEDD